MLGLTATPFRTNEQEKGHLGKVFPDDFVYQISMKELIDRGILAEPKFEEIDTCLDLTRDLDEEQICKISQGFELETIGKEVAKKIADNSERNALIVNQYVKNKERYGKTLVFALNAENTFALNKLFQNRGIRSDYVMSNIHDETGRFSRSTKENSAIIKRFKDGELDVLVNIVILTEGTDVPDVQTAFLTRPTQSKSLMTQMMGRALRGTKAGGTKDAYIVTFIDQWSDKVAWVNPEQLYIDDTPFIDNDSAAHRNAVRLIAISKIEEFAILCDRISDPVRKAQIESVNFIKRIPVGFYQFRYPTTGDNDGENGEKVCDILVYEILEAAYREMITDLPTLFGKVREENSERDTIEPEELYRYSNFCEDRYFEGTDRYPVYRIEDIDDLLRFYFITGETPKFFPFKDREKFDIDKIAQEIVDQDMGRRTQDRFLDEKWEREKESWEAFFNYKPRIFREEIFHAIERILHPEEHRPDSHTPDMSYEQRKFEDMDLEAIRLADPEYHSWLKKKVFERYCDDGGNYHSASGNYISSNRSDFEIDHIKPISKGGKTTLDNLQLLHWRENRKKGDKWNPPAPEKDSPKQRRNATRLRVATADGSIIEEASAAETFIEALRSFGISKLEKMNISYGNKPLVSKEPAKGYGRKPVNERYIFMNTSTATKKQLLERIGDETGHLLWHVYIVEK